jgi:thymidine phosphorylase
MVYELGGPADLIDNCEKHLPVASLEKAVYPAESGYVAAVDAFTMGNAIIELGGGRNDAAQLAAAMIREAYQISDSPPAERPVIYETLVAD